MSRRTRMNKGESTAKKQARRTARGNFWVRDTRTAPNSGKTYGTIRAIRYEQMSPQAAALARMIRKQLAKGK